MTKTRAVLESRGNQAFDTIIGLADDQKAFALLAQAVVVLEEIASQLADLNEQLSKGQGGSRIT